MIKKTFKALKIIFENWRYTNLHLHLGSGDENSSCGDELSSSDDELSFISDESSLVY